METCTKGYKFRIYPTAEQKYLIDCTLGCARFVYNHFLGLRSTSGRPTTTESITKNRPASSPTSSAGKTELG